jgi:hypothetical protein
MKGFSERTEQPNCRMFYKWEKMCRAGCLEKKHWSIIHGQNRLKQLQAGPLHREMVAADVLETFKT